MGGETNAKKVSLGKQLLILESIWKWDDWDHLKASLIPWDNNRPKTKYSFTYATGQILSLVSQKVEVEKVSRRGEVEQNEHLVSISSRFIIRRNLTGRQQFSNYLVFIMSSWNSPHKSNEFCKSRVFLREAASPSTIQKSRHDQKGVKLWPSREQIKFLAIKVLQKGVSLFHWGELLRSVIFKNYFSVVLWDLILVFPAISLDPNWCYSIHSK